ncbi:MAG: hypothetical protein OEM38_11275 [Gammaproteobacteria bacterium]|nr:hypothetical protein [Gammaproteobacteria bacterium]
MARITTAIHRQAVQATENIAVSIDAIKPSEKIASDAACCPCPKCHQGVLLVSGLVSPQREQSSKLINH